MGVNKIYHGLLEEILSKGTLKEASRGQSEGTLSAFGKTTSMIFDLKKGIPVISTKKVWTKGIIKELLWFLNGDTNVKTLREDGVHIWDDNAYDLYQRLGGNLPKSDFLAFTDAGAEATLKGTNYIFGDLGRMYGYQWRRKSIVTINDQIETIDPLALLIYDIRKNPNSRQHVLNTYDKYDTTVSALPPCHTMPFFFNCSPLSRDERKTLAEDILREPIFDYNEQLFEDLQIPKYYLNSEMIQRSGDAFLGVPFNITSSALMACIVAESCGMLPGMFTHHVIDAHIYNNHIDQVKEQLSRDVTVRSYFDYSIVWGSDPIVPLDILIDYSTPYGTIKAEMIV